MLMQGTSKNTFLPWNHSLRLMSRPASALASSRGKADFSRSPAFDHQGCQANRILGAGMTPCLQISFENLPFCGQRLKSGQQESSNVSSSFEARPPRRSDIWERPMRCCVGTSFCSGATGALPKNQCRGSCKMWGCIGHTRLFANWLPACFISAGPLPRPYGGYEAVFKGPNRCKFSIAGINGGWGAAGPIRQWKSRSPLLGPIVLEE